MGIPQHYYSGQAQELQEWIQERPREGKIIHLDIRSPEAKKADEQVAKLKRWMDRIGYTAMVVVGLLVVAAVVIQSARRFGW